MSRYRSQVLLALGLGFAAVACSEPELNTNLRPEGPPDVLAVLAVNPITFLEEAVHCKFVDGKRDPKGPGFVFGAQICPDDEVDFAPARLEARIDGAGWALRVMFDELLDADKVETLECTDVPDVGEICSGSLADTQPVTITCGAANTVVPYTGYYVPNGNNTTFPLGPSLFIAPDPDALTFATGTDCTLTLDPTRVTDKDGEAPPAGDLEVPAAIDDLKLLFTDPEDTDPPTSISPDPAVAGTAIFVFNANLASDVDGHPLDPAMFELKDGTGAVVPSVAYVGGYNSASDAIFLYPATATEIFLPGDYTATMKPGEIEEINGGKLTVTEAVSTTFTVRFGKIGHTAGTDFNTNGIIRISFNNSIDAASIGADDIEMFSTTSNTPSQAIPFTATVGNSTTATLANIANNAILITPTSELPLGTYVVRIKAGAEIKDTASHTATFAAPVAMTFNVLLKVTHTTPSAPPPPAPQTAVLLATGNFDIVFSGTLDPASVMATEFELTDLTTMMPVAIGVSVVTGTPRLPPAAPGHPNDAVRIDPNANLTVGRMYRVTLKPATSLSNIPVAGFKPVTRVVPTATWTFTAI